MAEIRSRIYIIDDEAIIRFGLSQLIAQEEDMTVVDSCASNEIVNEHIKASGANILIVDIPMPRERGINLLKKLSSLRLPIVVFTQSDKQITQDLIPLLEAGAVGLILKPEKNQTVTDIREQLVHEIRLNTKKPKKEVERFGTVSFLDPLKIVVVGSSTGGPEALKTLVGAIPENFPYGMVIVQHMPANFTSKFAERLNRECKIRIKEAEEGDVVSRGLILLAPGGRHLVFKEVRKGARRLAQAKLTNDPAVWGLRPTVDKMMQSIAPIYKQNCLGIILTGMGEDGVIGMREIKENGGKTLVQDKESSVVFGMAQQVIKNRLADEVLPLRKIMSKAIELLK